MLRALDRNSSPGIFRELVESFCEESAEALSSLDLSIRAGDFEGIRKAAHLLASMSGGVGAARFCQIAQGIEKWAGGAARGGEAPGLSELRTERGRAVSALKTSLGTIA